MDERCVQTIEYCSKASDEERISFGEVVMKLDEASVERYHADLLRSDKIFYMADGTSHRVTCHPPGSEPAAAFSSDGVKAAVQAIQGKTIKYREFCRRIAAAGCVGYIVSLAGRRAVYYGRSGENYIEPFPSAA